MIRTAIATLAAIVGVGAADAAVLSPSQIVDRHTAAVAASDVDAMMADYADDAVVLEDGKSIQGKAAIRALFERMFLKRGLDARPDLIQWLLARVERSHIALIRAVDVLDQAVLERRKRLSIPLAKATLTEASLIVDPAPTLPFEVP